jgi:TPR repeat protein
MGFKSVSFHIILLFMVLESGCIVCPLRTVRVQGAHKSRCPPESQDIKDTFRKAVDNYRQGDYNDAKEEYEFIFKHTDTACLSYYREAAQYWLGEMYWTGTGISKSASTALYYWEQAALTGHNVAAYNVGEIYYRGQGTGRSLRHAVKYYAIAAINRNTDAQYRLGQMYEAGEYFCKSLTSAYLWYSLAKTNNQAAAAKALELSLKLPKWKICRVDKQVKEWYKANQVVPGSYK